MFRNVILKKKSKLLLNTNLINKMKCQQKQNKNKYHKNKMKKNKIKIMKKILHNKKINKFQI